MNVSDSQLGRPEDMSSSLILLLSKGSDSIVVVGFSFSQLVVAMKMIREMQISLFIVTLLISLYVIAYTKSELNTWQIILSFKKSWSCYNAIHKIHAIVNLITIGKYIQWGGKLFEIYTAMSKFSFLR